MATPCFGTDDKIRSLIEEELWWTRELKTSLRAEYICNRCCHGHFEYCYYILGTLEVMSQVRTALSIIYYKYLDLDTLCLSTVSLISY